MNRIALASCVTLLLPACVSPGSRAVTRDCEHCPEMVVIPAGTAILGASADDKFRNPDEFPERTFVIRGSFAVSRYEVTRDQYEAFVRATIRPVGGDCLTDRIKRGDWQLDAATTFRDPGFAQAGDHPVACVNWDEAQAYIAWLNSQTDGGYRLLTEVEWEYVARGGATQNLVYPWGNDSAKGCPFANVFDRTMMAKYAGIDTSGHKARDVSSRADRGARSRTTCASRSASRIQPRTATTPSAFASPGRCDDGHLHPTAQRATCPGSREGLRGSAGPNADGSRTDDTLRCSSRCDGLVVFSRGTSDTSLNAPQWLHS